MPGLIDYLRSKTWNVFSKKEDLPREYQIASEDPSVVKARRDTTQAVLAPIITRLAIDASMVGIRHVNVDEYGYFLGNRNSPLNDIFQYKANIDQTGTSFIQDVVETMLSDGACVIVPTELSSNPKHTTSYDILSVRVGRILQHYNRTVEVEVYNELSGRKESIILGKEFAAICVNPWYNVMNKPNSTLRRLVDKLALLDIADNKAISPNLDVILQLPYAIRSDARQQEADKRLRMLEEQLYNSSYGVAYVDATEKITQLNRPVTNTLLDQVKALTDSLYNQLGLTQPIISGTASPQELVDYHNRTIGPILTSIVDAAKVSFLTKTARSQGQSLMAFPNIFKMAALSDVVEAADKFTRNEILSSNDFRAIIGYVPVNTPEANELRNKNINKPSNEEEV